ncbi:MULTISPECIES: hypothetical protein [Streptomyces]|uniref:hypothetical protein n=1 Tax=Streptomyces TaxID=1883 RepID=UPI00058DD313|nr:hypothetical protein [Streptomyces sp. SCSIO ZS0520]
MAGRGTGAAAPARGRPGALRVTAITSLVPLEELDREPFLVDSRSQYALCAAWAEQHGHVLTRQLLVHGLRPDHRALWTDVEAGLVDLFVAAGPRVLARALSSVEEFTAECARRGVRVESTGLGEPSYDAAMKADVHRRLSMPTAGYDGR